ARDAQHPGAAHPQPTRSGPAPPRPRHPGSVRDGVAGSGCGRPVTHTGRAAVDRERDYPGPDTLNVRIPQTWPERTIRDQSSAISNSGPVEERSVGSLLTTACDGGLGPFSRPVASSWAGVTESASRQRVSITGPPDGRRRPAGAGRGAERARSVQMSAAPVPGGGVRLTAWGRGRGQGGGSGGGTCRQGGDLGLTGRATNLAEGRVEVVAEGPEPACRELLARLRGPGSPGRVHAVGEQWSLARGDMPNFTLH